MNDEHVHTWDQDMHIDGCHYMANTYHCECGANLVSYDERDSVGTVSFDPGCWRCRELMRGAGPKHEQKIEEAPHERVLEHE